MKKSPMTRLDEAQLSHKKQFIQHYIQAENAAGGALLDPNANVSQKNIATMASELNKDVNIQINRSLLTDRIEKMYNKELADEYIRQIEAHEIYKHDESSLFPYCVSISMYPYLLHGTTQLGDNCDAPKHLKTYAGSFISLVFEVASQFAGAVATPEFLMILDYFARKDYGPNYLETHKELIEDAYNTVVYRLNAPAAARNYQAVFWNIAVFDEHYFKHLFEDFVFPETFDKPCWETVKGLQEHFLTWLNNERQKKILTFPIVTVNRLHKGDVYDREFLDMISKQAAEGCAFFTYTSPTVDSLSSCCRLRNELTDVPEFSYTLGAGGVATGSISVMSLNMNRLEQDPHRSLDNEISKLHCYQMAYRSIMQDYYNQGMLPVYTAGFISLDKQFSTIGLVGLADAAEFRGIKPAPTEEYLSFCQARLKIIYDLNRQMKAEHGVLFNTEQVPGEGLGVKFAKWDKEDGYAVNRDCYNSYFYLPEDDTITIADKFVMHGEDFVRYLDGGSALHLNLDDYPTKDGYCELFLMAARTGTNYFCTNIPVTICEDCGYINKHNVDKCSICGTDNVSHATRVIGFLKKITDFSKERQEEAARRIYH